MEQINSVPVHEWFTIQNIIYSYNIEQDLSVAILVAWPHGTGINKLIVFCIICQTTDLSVSPRLPMACHHVRSFQNSCNYICSCATCILLSVVTCSYTGTSYHITGNFQGMKFLQISWLIMKKYCECLCIIINHQYWLWYQ